jgi:ferritin-like metal-binding protein YciE
MGLFGSHEFNTLEDLFCHQLEDLYDAETRLTKALPKMQEAAHAPALKEAFKHHLQETETHVKRLEQIFQQLGKKPHRETCPAMKGLITEGEEMIQAKGDDSVRDAALVAAAQRVEHYEMAGYGTARTFAQRLGHQAAAGLLEATLNEEKAADAKLTQLAEGVVNPRAATSSAHN